MPNRQSTFTRTAIRGANFVRSVCAAGVVCLDRFTERVVKGMIDMPPARKVGMEIEFDSAQIAREPLYQAFEQEIRAKSSFPTLRMEGPNQWTLKSDGSCGWEITSPAIPFTELGVREISQVIRSISHRLPARICTPRCGIHVHVEGKTLTSAQTRDFFGLWYNLEPAVWSLHTPNRPDAYYVRSLRSIGSGVIATGHSDVVNIRGREDGDRRYEMRHCESTVDAEDIQYWLMTILYLTALGERAGELTVPFVQNTEPSELQDLIWTYRSGINWLDSYRPDLVEWMTRRHQKMHHGGESIPSRLKTTAHIGMSNENEKDE